MNPCLSFQSVEYLRQVLPFHLLILLFLCFQYMELSDRPTNKFVVTGYCIKTICALRNGEVLEKIILLKPDQSRHRQYLQEVRQYQGSYLLASPIFSLNFFFLLYFQDECRILLRSVKF